MAIRRIRITPVIVYLSNLYVKGELKMNAPTTIDNATARAVVVANGVERLQQIYSTATDPASQTQVVIPVQPVGLVRGFLVKVEGTIRNTSATAITLNRTNFGAANLLRNIGFTDVNNTTRHATQGWHLNAINNAKQPILFGGAYAGNIPTGYGSNYGVMTCASTLAQNTDAAVQFYYYVPLSYSKTDLRGSMYAGIVNATAQLALEINPNPVVDNSTTDPGLAVYSGAVGALGGWKASTNVTITVWQDYIDQIPTVDGRPVLPLDDLSTLYSLNTINVTGLVGGQDFGIPFANFRSFLSSVLVYDNNGTYNAGTDINYFALQTANSSNIWKYGPEEAALLARSTFMADPPTGMYYFDHRIRPIATQQWGNTQITVNPSAVTAGASIWGGYEYFTPANQVVFAGSLPSG